MEVHYKFSVKSSAPAKITHPCLLVAGNSGPGFGAMKTSSSVNLAESGSHISSTYLPARISTWKFACPSICLVPVGSRSGSLPTWPQGRDQPPPSRAARRRWGSRAPWGGSGCGGGPFAPTACHTHPRWQAASQPSHPSLPCLTVLLLHLVELPEVGEQHFPRSSQLARAKLKGRGEHSYFEASTFKHPSSAILDQKNQFRCLQYYNVLFLQSTPGSHVCVWARGWSQTKITESRIEVLRWFCSTSLCYISLFSGCCNIAYGGDPLYGGDCFRPCRGLVWFLPHFFAKYKIYNIHLISQNISRKGQPFFNISRQL